MSSLRKLFIDDPTWKLKATILGVILAATVVSTLLVVAISYATR